MIAAQWFVVHKDDRDTIRAEEEQSQDQKEVNQEFLFSGPKGRLSDRNIQKIVRTTAKKARINKAEVQTAARTS